MNGFLTCPLTMNQCRLCLLHCQALGDLTGCMHCNTLHALVIRFAVATKTSIWLMQSFVGFEVKGCYQWGPEETDNSLLPGVKPVVGWYFCSFVFCYSWGTVLMLIACHWNSLELIDTWLHWQTQYESNWMFLVTVKLFKLVLFEEPNIFVAVIWLFSIKDTRCWQTI